MTASPPSGWCEVELRELLSESDERVGDRSDLPLLSVTKYAGAVLARDRFSRVLASKDLSRYRVASRNSVVIDPMLLWDGVIALQHRFVEGVVSPDYRVFRFTSDTDPQFFDYLAHSPAMRRQYARAARGTNVRRRRISRDDFLAIRIVVPPSHEQREIAAAIKVVDDAILAGEAVVEQLDLMRRRLALELVTRGIARNDGGRVVAGPVTCPSAWQVKRIEQVVSSCDYGLSCAMSLDASGVACLRMGNIQSGDVVLDDLKYVPRGEADDGLLLTPGDVLFNRTNSKDLVGKVGLFKGSGRPVTFASYLLRLRVNPELASGEWVAAVLNLDPYQRHIRSMATPGISQANVNRTRLLAIEIPVPTLGEQCAILGALGAASERAAKEREALAQRRVAKAALADALLGGRLRVRDAA